MDQNWMISSVLGLDRWAAGQPSIGFITSPLIFMNTQHVHNDMWLTATCYVVTMEVSKVKSLLK